MADHFVIGKDAGIAGPLWRRGTSIIPYVVRTPDGYLVVMPTYEPGRVSVFSPTGRLEAVIGHPGEGPGEFQRPTVAGVAHDGTIVIWDEELRRISEFTAFGQFRTSYGARFFITDLLATDSTVVIALENKNPRRPMAPVAILLRADGSTLEQVGPLPSKNGAYAGSQLALRGDTLFVAAMADYRIDVHVRGQVVRSLQRSGSWLPDDPLVLSRSRVLDIAVDSAGLLWTLFKYPDPDFVPAEKSEMSVEGPILSAGDAARRMVQIIEVIDPRSGALIATKEIRTHEFTLTQFVQGPFVVGLSEDPDGVALLEFWRLRIDGIRSMSRQ